MWLCTGSRPETGFLLFNFWHSLLSIFARTALAFCAALPWKTQAEQSQPKIRRNFTSPVSSLKPNSFWNLHLQKFYSYREKIWNVIFYCHNVSFSTSSAFTKQSGIKSLCASDPLKVKKSVVLQLSCKVSVSLRTWKNPLVSCLERCLPW